MLGPVTGAVTGAMTGAMTGVVTVLAAVLGLGAGVLGRRGWSLRSPSRGGLALGAVLALVLLGAFDGPRSTVVAVVASFVGSALADAGVRRRTRRARVGHQPAR